jgi:multidrug transporter EmrE-like cation transporter
MKPMLYIIASGILLTVGDLIMKKWVVSSMTRYYLIGLVAYFIGLNFLAQSYLYRHVAVATCLVNILNILVLVVVSALVFRDRLTVQEYVGIFLAISSLIVLNIK